MFNSSKPKSKSKSRARSPKSKQAKSVGRTNVRKIIRTKGFDSQQPSPIVASPFGAQSTRAKRTKSKKQGQAGKSGYIKPSLAVSYDVAQPQIIGGFHTNFSSVMPTSLNQSFLSKPISLNTSILPDPNDDEQTKYT